MYSEHSSPKDFWAKTMPWFSRWQNVTAWLQLIFFVDILLKTPFSAYDTLFVLTNVDTLTLFYLSGNLCHAWRLLHLALIHDKPFNVIRTIVKIACDKNDVDYLNLQNRKYYQTALHLAVLFNRPDVAELLVSTGARVDLLDSRGQTPFHVAAQRGRIQCLVAMAHRGQRDRISRIVNSLDYAGWTSEHKLFKKPTSWALASIRPLSPSSHSSIPLTLYALCAISSPNFFYKFPRLHKYLMTQYSQLFWPCILLKLQRSDRPTEF